MLQKILAGLGCLVILAAYIVLQVGLIQLHEVVAAFFMDIGVFMAVVCAGLVSWGWGW